jgi:hypothetical protein
MCVPLQNFNQLTDFHKMLSESYDYGGNPNLQLFNIYNKQKQSGDTQMSGSSDTSVMVFRRQSYGLLC